LRPNQVSHYTLGDDAARFGVVSFNDLATLRVNLTHNAAEIDAGIDEMTASGLTSISSGFLMTRQLFADHARVNATKIALLLSDGQDGGAVAAAALVKGDHVTVFAWGFGGAHMAELQQLASDPSKAVLGTNLFDLTSYLAPLQAAACALPPPSLPPSPPPPPPPSPSPPPVPPPSPPPPSPSPPPPCGKYVTAKGGVAFSHHCPPPSPPSSPSPPPPSPSPPSSPPHDCATPLDFVLVLDESGSMSYSMDGLKAFAKELVRHYSPPRLDATEADRA
jgi:hypothetical protein